MLFTGSAAVSPMLLLQAGPFQCLTFVSPRLWNEWLWGGLECCQEPSCTSASSVWLCLVGLSWARAVCGSWPGLLQRQLQCPAPSSEEGRETFSWLLSFALIYPAPLDLGSKHKNYFSNLTALNVFAVYINVQICTDICTLKISCSFIGRN